MKNDKIELWMRVHKNGEVPYWLDDQRLRIIYPDGKAEWSDGWTHYSWSEFFPCWHSNCYVSNRFSFNLKSKMTKRQAIAAMKEYDEVLGYKTVKIGEL